MALSGGDKVDKRWRKVHHHKGLPYPRRQPNLQLKLTQQGLGILFPGKF